MLTVNKIRSASPIDYAAEELKKYLRMMMPECGDIKISYNPLAKDGFRLGLMQDFGLDTSDAEDTELDDILYIDCDERGGIIAGDNTRSVLLSVYEYLRQNGCRWLLPGVDGEYIPMQDIKPVKYRHKPSCRYRGWCNEGAEFQQCMMETIEFTPKVGMNVYMIENIIPMGYYRQYYDHSQNSENRPPEPVSERQVLQWKRQCEAEIAKRGLQFHDIGHGFTCEPFGFSSALEPNPKNDELITPESREFLAKIGGKRKFFLDMPAFTNICMSNIKARSIVAKYVTDYAKKHGNIDYLHVWLADNVNNHCECSECQKKIPSDFYMILLNEIDEMLTKEKLKTRIVFIAYVDTTWAPLSEKIKNSERFTLLFAPIYRSYAYSIPNGIRQQAKLIPYNRNKNEYPRDLATSLDYLDEWKKVFDGSCIAYEYHFWRHQCYDLGGIDFARLICDDVKLYKENGVNGIIEDGSQRSFFPNGLPFYTYARTLFNTSLSFEEIEEDYLSHVYGEDWKLFRDYLKRISDALPLTFFSRDEARKTATCHYSPDMAKRIAKIREITNDGRELIKTHYNSDFRVRTVAVRMLEKHACFCDLISDWMAAKARGETDEANRLMHTARIATGKFENEIKLYFDHHLYFADYTYTQNATAPRITN